VEGGGTGEELGTGDEVEMELESEGEAGSGARLVILDKKVKKEKKKRNFRGGRWRNSTEPEENHKTETRSMNSRNECTEKCRNHKQSQAVKIMLQAMKS